MNANVTIRTLVGVSILVAICQSAARAGGISGGPHFGNGISSASAFKPTISNVVHTTSIQKVQTLNASSFKFQNTVTTPNNSQAPVKLSLVTKVNPVLPVSPVTGTGGSTPTGPGNGLKFPIGGIKAPPGVFAPPTGGSNPPNGGGTTPPSGGGSTPPSNGSNHDHGFPYWLWYNPALYANWGYGYGGGYSGAPAYVNDASVAPVALNQSPDNPAQANAASKMTMQPGKTYTIVNENFGESAGAMALQVNGVTLPVHVDKWDAREITFTLPAVGLAKATDGVFQIMKVDHTAARTVAVEVVAAQ
jgi:hypothetical protein